MKTISRHLPTAARILLGLIFFVFGLNGFLHFIPNPTEAMPDKAVALMGGLIGTGYMFPLIKGTEVIGGALLLTNRFVPLALAFLAPVIVNIVAFHTLLVPSGAGFAIFILAMEVFLAWSYRAVYRPMLAARVSLREPATESSSARERVHA
ncbi:MAG: DoxX family protein [Polyangiaceae bacterium]